MVESFECIVISLSKVRINKYFFMISKTGTLGVPGDCDKPALVALAWADKSLEIDIMEQCLTWQGEVANVSTLSNHQGISDSVSDVGEVSLWNISSSDS